MHGIRQQDIWNKRAVITKTPLPLNHFWQITYIRFFSDLCLPDGMLKFLLFPHVSPLFKSAEDASNTTKCPPFYLGHHELKSRKQPFLPSIFLPMVQYLNQKQSWALHSRTHKWFCSTLSTGDLLNSQRNQSQTITQGLCSAYVLLAIVAFLCQTKIDCACYY